ncbi:MULTISPECIES: hypothetical protein [unclassified Delftia]|uniref:hypothetical protein n=1 Tax=unclassified Delftia TaxID=2613839 RepID=UPI0019020C4B|nr:MULTISPECIES: hypothetical protein [unclassified Delftia]MBK0115635.1 hypothetical protein [Delftia sp. S65]MBK0119508.1 hypothetical protein [Delftia sp. S67]MBK0130188.1 hypothetical protein [Delftia sp. S66]
MKFDKLEYTGKKPYHDRHAATHWEPGDTKLVPEAVARKLLRFVEFRRAPVDQQQAGQLQPADQQDQQDQQAQQPDTTQAQDDAALQQAQAAQQQAEQLQQQERAATEAMLLTIEGMDKGALAEYAAKYEVKLDARKGEIKMRAEVANLIEQFGAR